MVALIDSNNFYALYAIASHGMKVCVLTHSSDRRKRIQGIATYDTQCETPEGISPGASYGDIKWLATGVPQARYGWGHFWSLPSGWIAMFLEGSTKEEPLTDDSRVALLVSFGADKKLNELMLNKAAQPK